MFMGHEQSLFFVFFVYGLAFFGMGLAMAMESGRGSALADGRALRSLAGFGLIHGTHEWLESYLAQAATLGASLPAWLPWLRLGLLVGSFSLLLLFSFQALRLVEAPKPRSFMFVYAALACYVIIILISAMLTYQAGTVPWSSVLDALARYLLAVPASMLAALGLRARSLKTFELSAKLSANLNVVSISFGLYALSQLFVHPISIFPANLINEETFIFFAGFPIQIVRAGAAVVITIGLLRATQETDRIRQMELLSAQKARLDALEQQQEIRRELLRHTVRAQEDERARIARELHDETAQSLTAFSLELATLKHNLPRRDASNRTVERLLDLSREMSQSLYRLMTGLRPMHLDELGVGQAVRALVDRDYTPAGFAIPVEVTGAPRRLDPIAETVLFRVAQEALTNIARHAGVKEGSVVINYGPKQVSLRVSDRGRGFNPTENFHPPHGWGLEGMKERVESVGGRLQIESAPGNGTTIEALIPVAPGGKEQT
jgi:signal transduction histidine kinase